MEPELMVSDPPNSGSFWSRWPERFIQALGQDWRYLAQLAIIFGLGIWCGSMLWLTYPDIAQRLYNMAMNQFRELLQAMQGAPVYKEILLIWSNNLTASAGAILMGLLVPVVPLLFVFGNGAVVGLFQNYLAAETGLTAGRFYLALLPHGILELSAFFIAAWVGVRAGLVCYGFIGRLIWKGFTGKVKNSGSSPVEYFKDTARYYLMAVVLMLLVAATIEVTISPLLLKR